MFNKYKINTKKKYKKYKKLHSKGYYIEMIEKTIF